MQTGTPETGWRDPGDEQPAAEGTYPPVPRYLYRSDDGADGPDPDAPPPAPAPVPWLTEADLRHMEIEYASEAPTSHIRRLLREVRGLQRQVQARGGPAPVPWVPEGKLGPGS